VLLFQFRCETICVRNIFNR